MTNLKPIRADTITRGHKILLIFQVHHII